MIHLAINAKALVIILALDKAKSSNHTVYITGFWGLLKF